MRRHIWRSQIVLPISLCIASLACGVGTAAADDIPIDRLRSHVYFLASDYLGGRVIGSPGYRIAAEYVASQFASTGLQSFAPEPESHGGFLHRVPLPFPNDDPGTMIDTLQPTAGIVTGACCNVVGCVPGTDPNLRGEYVLVCAHLDHIPPIAGEICNGADDNASGCAAVLEIAARVAQEPLARPILFVMFTGEDYLADPRLGSRYFLEHWPNARGRIFASVNLDMIGREDTYWPKPGAITVMDCDTVCPELREICAKAGERRQLPLHFDVSQGGASDNLTFAEAGIPSLGFFAGAHADLHKPSDEVDRLSFRRIQEVAGLALDVVRVLGSGETGLCR